MIIQKQKVTLTYSELQTQNEINFLLFLSRSRTVGLSASSCSTVFTPSQFVNSSPLQSDETLLASPPSPLRSIKSPSPGTMRDGMLAIVTVIVTVAKSILPWVSATLYV